MASMFLACKIEENPRRIRDICNVFWRIHQRREGKQLMVLDISGKVSFALNTQFQEYWEMKSTIINTEKFILKELGYVLQVVHPHKFLLNYIQILKGSKQLAQSSWNFLNDRFGSRRVHFKLSHATDDAFPSGSVGNCSDLHGSSIRWRSFARSSASLVAVV